jgi:acyl-CoA synthetase (NDP forming)
MMIDDYTAAGFAVPPAPQRLQQEVAEEVSRFVNTDAGFILNNPFDLTTLNSGEGHYQVLKRLAAYEGFDMLVGQVSVNNSGWPHKDFGYSVWPDFFTDAAIRVHRETDKPVVVIHSVLSNWDLQRAVALQQKCCEAGLPVFRSIGSAAKAMDQFLRYNEWRRTT